MKFLEKFSL